MGKSTPIETLALTPFFPDALRGLHLIYGHPMAREVGFYLTAAWLCQGHRAVVVDGENRFDPFVFSDAARRAERPSRAEDLPGVDKGLCGPGDPGEAAQPL